MFEAIAQAASRALVDLLEPMGDQPIAHGLFETTAMRLVGVEYSHHVGATNIQRLRNGQPILPGSALACHRLLAKAHNI